MHINRTPRPSQLPPMSAPVTRPHLIWALASSLTLLLGACDIGSDKLDGEGHTSAQINNQPYRGGKADGVTRTAVALPQPGGRGALAAWGGPIPEHWSPEAIFANAASNALSEHWEQTGVVEVVVASPVKLHSSQFNPYGDGQTNAALHMGHWEHPRPPLLGVLTVDTAGQRAVTLRFDSALPVFNAVKVEFVVNGAVEHAMLRVHRSDSGAQTATWAVPESVRWDVAALDAAQLVWITPDGWHDGWPLHFVFPSRDVDEVLGAVPANARAFSDGRSLPDPEALSSQGRSADDDASPFARATTHAFGPGYNEAPYEASDVHGVYPHRHQHATATGGSLAWVVTPPTSPFKQVYLCIDGRDPIQEASLGVPSGSGWHQIGDPAETILNTLENSPMLTGWAAQNPSSGTAWEGSNAAYGLSDVATARLLWPGEGFVTASSPHQAQFHWFATHSPTPTCTEIWVHPCPPDEQGRFHCGETSEVSVNFEVSNATTALGQSVYVVGSTPELGQWDPAKAFKLQPTGHATWGGTTTLPPGSSARFKFIKRDAQGQTQWESGADRELWVPAAGDVDVEGTWR